MKRYTMPISSSFFLVFTVFLHGILTSTALAENPAYTFAQRVGSETFERTNAIALDSDGNMYVTGAFKGTLDFDPGSGTASLTPISTGTDPKDLFVASYDADGNYRWAFNIGGTPPNGTGLDIEGYSVAVDGNSNVVVCGLFSGTMDFDPGSGTASLYSEGWGTFVAKYSSTGSYLWALKIGPYTSQRPSVAIDANNNIVVAGTFSGIVDFNPGSGTNNLTSTKVSKKGTAGYSLDAFVAKYSSAGAYVWAFRVGSSTLGTYNEYAYDVDVDDNSNIYITGKLSGATTDFNPGSGTANLTGNGNYVAKYTSAGAYTWAFGVNVSFTTDPRIGIDNSGNVITTGGFTGTVDFNPGSGTANLTASGTNDNLYIAKYSSSGTYQWAFSPSQGRVMDVSTDSDDNVYVTGTFRGTNDFDPGSGVVSLPVDTAVYDGGAFFAKYSSTGTYDWAFSAFSAISPMGIEPNGAGDIFVTGGFGGSTTTYTVDFDPSTSTANLTSVGTTDIFIAKYTEPSAPMQDAGPVANINDDGGEPLLFMGPNPFTSELTIRFNQAPDESVVEIVDLAGRIMETHNATGMMELIVGRDLMNGTYMLRISQGMSTQQVLVQKSN